MLPSSYDGWSKRASAASSARCRPSADTSKTLFRIQYGTIPPSLANDDDDDNNNNALVPHYAAFVQPCRHDRPPPRRNQRGRACPTIANLSSLDDNHCRPCIFRIVRPLHIHFANFTSLAIESSLLQGIEVSTQHVAQPRT